MLTALLYRPLGIVRPYALGWLFFRKCNAFEFAANTTTWLFRWIRYDDPVYVYIPLNWTSLIVLPAMVYNFIFHWRSDVKAQSPEQKQCTARAYSLTGSKHSIMFAAKGFSQKFVFCLPTPFSLVIRSFSPMAFM